jgi:hypothetical protein
MFSLIDMVWHNLPEQYAEQFPSKKSLLNELKFQVGFVVPHRTLGGKTQYIPKSIAYDSMGQEEFNGFFTSVIEVVLKYFLPGISDEQIRDEILQTAGGSTWR